MLLNGRPSCTDEDRRRIYVGMTRARRSLEIHTTSPEFDSLSFPGYRPEKDERRYEEPETILLQLGHGDVNLGFFRGRNERRLQLCAGKKLLPRKNSLADEEEALAETVTEEALAEEDTAETGPGIAAETEAEEAPAEEAPEITGGDGFGGFMKDLGIFTLWTAGIALGGGALAFLTAALWKVIRKKK
jgi:ATP-dependent exoDNAse (exonuclease V) beta subunit